MTSDRRWAALRQWLSKREIEAVTMKDAADATGSDYMYLAWQGTRGAYHQTLAEMTRLSNRPSRVTRKRGMK